MWFIQKSSKLFDLIKSQKKNKKRTNQFFDFESGRGGHRSNIFTKLQVQEQMSPSLLDIIQITTLSLT